jgi:outer membrane receptor protein involved in Fe transport
MKYIAPTNEVYTYGNSFGVVYDNVKTFRVTGGLHSDLTKDVAVGVRASLSKYTLAQENYAWNLPLAELHATTEIAFLPKWSVGADVFFVGERKDFQLNQMVMPANLPFVEADYTRTLPYYFDANLHLNYQHNARLSAYLKGNNLANQSYQRWLNYPVQGLQVLLGAAYKFDF